MVTFQVVLSRKMDDETVQDDTDPDDQDWLAMMETAQVLLS